MNAGHHIVVHFIRLTQLVAMLEPPKGSEPKVHEGLIDMEKLKEVLLNATAAADGTKAEL